VSIEKVTRKDGKVSYRVRWREDGRNRARTYSRREDARAADADITRRKRLGTLADLDAGKETLDTFVQDVWVPAYAANLAPKTREVYAGLYGNHVGPQLGGVPLRGLTVDRITGWQAERVRYGAGKVAVRRSLGLLSGILQRAVEHGRIPTNAARNVRPVKANASPEVRPLPPAVVERMRAAVGPRDAVLVSILAYAGLRPGEALGLRWRDIRERTILVERAVSLGEFRTTKTGQTRAVRMLAPVAQDLAEWRMRSGRPGDKTLVFPRDDGEPWTTHNWANWRRRPFADAIAAAGVENARPYDLRHSFASLLLAEGRTIHYVAKQLGHSALMTLNTYGHVIDELEDDVRVDPEKEIVRARGAVPASYLSGAVSLRDGASPKSSDSRDF
jgi:integrase